MAGFSDLHRSDEGQLSTQISVVDLNATVELARFFPHRHDLHQLVFQQPGGLVAHPQVTFKFQRRYALFFD